jgi:GntR family transcriptional regulator
MLRLDNNSPVPIYEQIKAELRGLVARGLLKTGDQIPSIRALSQMLLLNPNTIARAYRELVTEGFLETRRGEGNYISDDARSNVSNNLDAVRKQLIDVVLASRRAGLSWKDIQLLMQKARSQE